MKMTVVGLAGVLAISLMASTATAKEVQIIRNGAIDTIQLAPTTVVDEGLACKNADDVVLGYSNPMIISMLIGERKCFLVEPGEVYDVSSTKAQYDFVEFYGGHNVFLYAPAYTFGVEE